MFPKRTVIASYKLAAGLKAKYPTRSVIADPVVDHDCFYYFGVNNKVWLVNVVDKTISVCDTDSGWPLMKVVRKFKWLKKWNS